MGAFYQIVCHGNRRDTLLDDGDFKLFLHMINHITRKPHLFQGMTGNYLALTSHVIGQSIYFIYRNEGVDCMIMRGYSAIPLEDVHLITKNGKHLPSKSSLRDMKTLKMNPNLYTTLYRLKGEFFYVSDFYEIA